MNFIRRNSVRKICSEIFLNKLIGENLGITIVSINRPKSKNALGKNLISELGAIIKNIKFDSTTRVIILKSSIKGVFCAGADLKERIKMSEEEVSTFVHSLRSTFTDWENLKVPTIACIDGVALGGGLELAMACDLRVGGKNAILGLPETSLAIIPGAGGTQRLPRIIGTAKAKELIFTAKRINVSQSFELGLLNQYTIEGSAYSKALKLAKDISKNAPIAVRLAKIAIDSGIDAGSKASGMSIEQLCYAQVIPTKDRIEGIKAFREKRTPHYKGE